MKLGKELLERGLVTEEQLRLALERQVLFGRRIGTNLVEMGFLKEEDLVDSLEKCHGVKKESPIQDDERRLRKVKKEFAGVGGREELGRILIREARRAAKRTALFKVKGLSAIGWFGEGLDVMGFQTSSSNLFGDIIRTRSHFRGAIPKEDALIGLLGGAPPESLVIPINIEQRVIGLLYADNGNHGVLDAGLSYLNTLCRLASHVFDILVIKKKMLEL